MSQISINIEELKEATREKGGIRLTPTISQVGDSLIALGRVFHALKGLPDDEVLRVLQQAQLYFLIRNFPEIDEERPGSYVPPLKWMIQVVARSFHLTPADLKGRSRVVKVALARQVVMYVSVMTNKYNLGEIGRELGGRTPATVSYGFQHVSELLGKDRYLSGKVLEISSILSYKGFDHGLLEIDKAEQEANHESV